MKKIVLIFVALLLFFGCSPNDENNTKFHLELLPIHSSTFPAQFTQDVEYDIPIQFIKPSNCNVFEGFYYDKNLNIRTIAIQSSVLEQDNCIVAPQPPSTQILRFKPTTETSYVFKLWKGVDASGADIYQEITIPVIP
ncbi:hypothetical protein [Flavobacterium sp.]|uniref:hypothetical protein n=1 Tax=Flavobacterium sp. TaxID=239 RepID=UPI00286B68CF|nr:hypothetical protein [Flavobacterium sp.]